MLSSRPLHLLSVELRINNMMLPAVMNHLRLLMLTLMISLPNLAKALFVAPSMSPDVVVRKQLDALRAGDMYAVFKHASPNNKAAMGPLARFSAMVKSPPYDVLLSNKRAELMMEMKASDTQWIGRVRVWSAERDRLPVDFVWQLSRVSDEGLFENCWMVDGVFPIPAGA